MKIDGRTKKVLFHAWMNGNWNKRRIDDSILSSNNTNSDSFFEPYLKSCGKSDTENEDEQSQTKRKYSNTSSSIDEQPNKRRCKAEKFEAIQYSLGPNEEYISIRIYVYNVWERNKDNLPIIYQDIFQKKDEGWKTSIRLIMESILGKLAKARILELNEDILKDYYFEDQYAVSIRKLRHIRTCLTKDYRRIRSIRRITKETQYAVFKKLLLYLPALVCILEDIKPSRVSIYSKKSHIRASKTKSWLWHRRLSHLNFDAINLLARHGLVRGLPKLKFEKDHMCSACAMGKRKKKPHKPKSEDTNQEKLYLLHMDLCGPMRVASVNERMRLKVPVRRIRIDNGTEFVNQNLREYYVKVGISHETSVARSPQTNGIIEREAVATACYTQNRSIIRLRHGKTPYELLHDKLPDLSFFHVFGALCYPTNDSENLGKLQLKADIDFDELTAMASEHSSSGPALHEMTSATISSGLMPNPPPSTLVDRLAPEVNAPIFEVVTPEPAASTGSPSLITVDQDAPSLSKSQTKPKTQSPVISNDVEEENHDLDVAHMNNDPFFGILIPKTDSEASSSSDVIPTVVHTAAPNSEHVTK
ncbi:retrovirus-related pol polyprotein from transposon TNT 1-94 [Tanacetum coccineum]